MSPYDTVCARLGERTGGTGRGGQWPCPAHDDASPSLSVGQGRDGRVLVHCHAGCSTSDIAAALDLTMADLFNGAATNGTRRVEDARYRYDAADGTHLFDVVRYWTPGGKTFRQQAADGTWSTRNVSKVPYRLPQVIEAVAAGETVFIVEGEKDVHALDRAGYWATTNPGGASKWRSDYDRYFAGADVVVVADRDTTGRAHARDVVDRLSRVTDQVRLVEAAEGKDVSDHFAAGLGVEDLVLLDLDATSGDDCEEELASWRPVDLSAALRGDKVKPAPGILQRSDGRHLFYEGQINYLHGADGVGKSYVGLFAAVDVVNDGGHVVWLDWEDPDETTIVARLLDLGVKPDTIQERFHYHHPEHEAVPTAVAMVCDLIRNHEARLVVVDSIGEALGVDGVNEDKDNEVTPWFRWILRPLAATGAAVLPIDHGIKPGDNPLHPSGSKRKRAMVTGSAFLVDATRPLSQEYAGGQLKLTCAKDRHGNYTRGKTAAVIDVTIYDDGGWTYHVHPPEVAVSDPAANDKALARAMVRVIKDLADETGRPPSLTMVEQSKRVKGAVQSKRAAVEYALACGAVREESGPRKSRLFHYVKDLPT